MQDLFASLKIYIMKKSVFAKVKQTRFSNERIRKNEKTVALGNDIARKDRTNALAPSA